ncbi:MAG: hypothetical protein WA655_23740 [Candidatus Korobacteraceae bacterium]
MSAHAGRLQLSGWRGIFLLLMVGGAAAAFLAGQLGLASTTRLSDTVPWGLCLGLNVFCGIALAVGALSLSCIAFIIGGSQWRVVGRACLLAGSLSYAIAMLGTLANQAGDEGWRLLFAGWTPRSVVSGGGWTLLLLALLLFLEFLPQHSLWMARTTWFAMLSRLDLPLLILLTILAVVQQYGLNRLIRVAGAKFSPLWTGPSVSVLFYLSSLALALAVLLFASWRSRLAFDQALPSAVQPAIARLLTAAVFVYLVLRLLDLMERGLLWSIFSTSREGLLILLEIVLLLAGMVWIKGSEEEPRELFIGSALIIAGVIANRLNTAITALEAGAGQDYLPRWGEFLISYSLIGAGVAGFALGVKHLSVFSEIEPSRRS